MLNYILPPIIILICASYLIIFLFKKTSQIPEQEMISSESNSGEKKKFSFVFSAIGHFGLKVLERLMHRLKLLSLKLHNTSNIWFQSIREKRQERMWVEQEMTEKKSIEKNISKEENFARPAIVEIPEEKEVKPMIRESVTRPQSHVHLREKNKMEDALIKRIAVNPKDIEAYERLGDYYLESGNMQDSLECFRQVLRLSPTHHKARLRIRRLEKALKQ